MSEHARASSDLDVRYGGVQAVRGLSFEVAPGRDRRPDRRRTAPGKSSTLHAIMGVAPVDRRRRPARRRVAARARARRTSRASGVALVPEGRRIFAELTVEENLRLGLAARRSRGGADSECSRGVYELFPIVEEFRAPACRRALGRPAAAARDRARARRRAGRAAARRAVARARADRRRRRLRRARGDPRARARGAARRAARAAHRRARRPLPRARERRAAAHARPGATRATPTRSWRRTSHDRSAS